MNLGSLECGDTVVIHEDLLAGLVELAPWKPDRPLRVVQGPWYCDGCEVDEYYATVEFDEFQRMWWRIGRDSWKTRKFLPSFSNKLWRAKIVDVETFSPVVEDSLSTINYMDRQFVQDIVLSLPKSERRFSSFDALTRERKVSVIVDSLKYCNSMGHGFWSLAKFLKKMDDVKVGANPMFLFPRELAGHPRQLPEHDTSWDYQKRSDRAAALALQLHSTESYYYAVGRGESHDASNLVRIHELEEKAGVVISALMTQHRSDEIRNNSLETLCGYSTSFGSLCAVRQLQDSESWVREDALDRLCQIAPELAREKAELFINDADSGFANMCKHVVEGDAPYLYPGRIIEPDVDPELLEKLYDLSVQAVFGETDSDRIEALDALISLDEMIAKCTLAICTNVECPVVRKAALEKLNHVDQRFASLLADTMTDDPNSAVQALAVRIGWRNPRYCRG